MGIKVREKQPGSGVWWLFGHHQGSRWSKKVGDLEIAEEVKKRLDAKVILGQFNLEDVKEKTMAQYKYLLEEKDLPTHWYNVISDMNPPNLTGCTGLT